MKRFITIALVIMIASVSYAADSTPITESTIKAFLKIWPSYKEITSKYSTDSSSKDLSAMMNAAPQFKKELDSILKKYNMTAPEFSSIMMKITIGFASAQMNPGIQAR